MKARPHGPGDRRIDRHRTGHRAGARPRRLRPRRHRSRYQVARRSLPRSRNFRAARSCRSRSSCDPRTASRRRSSRPRQAFGSIDLVVNNAGRPLPKPAIGVTWAEWNDVIDINLKGSFFLSTAFARHCIARKRGGAVVSMASTHGLTGIADRSVYGISKGGIVQMTRMLAIEWAPLGHPCQRRRAGDGAHALAREAAQRSAGAGAHAGTHSARAFSRRRRGCRSGVLSRQRRRPIDHRADAGARWRRDGDLRLARPAEDRRT